MSDNILSGITDHLPNFVIINKLAILPQNCKLYKRDFSALDKEALITEVSSINWIEILPCSDSTNGNYIFRSFYSHVARINDEHAPIRKLSKKEIKSLSKPWVSTGLKVSIKKR